MRPSTEDSLLAHCAQGHAKPQDIIYLQMVRIILCLVHGLIPSGSYILPILVKWIHDVRQDG